VLKFFTAYLKKEAEALAFLTRTPEANGVPSRLATVRAMPAVIPAPTVDEVFAIVSTQGVGAAMQRLDEARKTDPQADLFQEARLNRLGYRVLRSRSAANSIPIFRRIVELFPASSNAYDSLAEALEAAGERREAVAVTEKALEVLAKQELTPEQRRDMAELLEARLKRLK
jgi:tetratricopeptide (TPR) repeat protein